MCRKENSFLCESFSFSEDFSRNFVMETRPIISIRFSVFYRFRFEKVYNYLFFFFVFFYKLNFIFH